MQAAEPQVTRPGGLGLGLERDGNRLIAENSQHGLSKYFYSLSQVFIYLTNRLIIRGFQAFSDYYSGNKKIEFKNQHIYG